MSAAGRRVLVVSRYDGRGPRSGDVERYLYEITRHWVADGAEVTWVAPRMLGTVARLLRDGARFDVVLAATGGSVDLPALVTGGAIPVVEVLHRVPPRPAGRWGQLLAGRRDRAERARVVLSPSARHDLRRRHRLPGPIFIVPPGTSPVTSAVTPGPVPVPAVPSALTPAVSPALTPAVGGRAAVPTIVVDVELFAEERVESLLDALPTVVAALPDLRVEILGTGPELARLRRLAGDLRLARTVTLHGRVGDDSRDRWLRRAWLTVATGGVDVPAARLLTAAAYGVPSVVCQAPGARDFVRVGRTGWLVDTPQQLAETLVRQLTGLADETVAERVGTACRAWAGRFTWARSAALLAGVVEHQIRLAGSDLARRRSARSDIAALVRLPPGAAVPPGALRPTDEVVTADGQVSLLLNGCDEVDALGVLARLDITGARLRLAGHDDLLTGPHPLPPALAGAPHHRPLAFYGG